MYIVVIIFIIDWNGREILHMHIQKYVKCFSFGDVFGDVFGIIRKGKIEGDQGIWSKYKLYDDIGTTWIEFLLHIFIPILFILIEHHKNPKWNKLRKN